jgi:hypothetical protein
VPLTEHLRHAVEGAAVGLGWHHGDAIGRALDAGRDRLSQGDSEPAIGASREGEASDHRIVGGVAVLLGDVVTQAVRDPLAVDPLDRLDDVGVVADD